MVNYNKTRKYNVILHYCNITANCSSNARQKALIRAKKELPDDCEAEIVKHPKNYAHVAIFCDKCEVEYCTWIPKSDKEMCIIRCPTCGIETEIRANEVKLTQ